jgi:hypothetical protein
MKVSFPCDQNILLLYIAENYTVSDNMKTTESRHKFEVDFRLSLKTAKEVLWKMISVVLEEKETLKLKQRYLKYFHSTVHFPNLQALPHHTFQHGVCTL